MDSLAEFGADVPLILNVVVEPVDGIDDAFARENEKFLGRLAISFTPWSLVNTWRVLAASDLVIIPSADNEVKTAKSPNRVVESLRNGRFVVAHPVDA